MSDKGFEGSDKMSVEFVKEARGMSDFLVHKVFQGPGDNIDSAMYRAQSTYGAPYSWLHRLRYRHKDLREIPTSAFFSIYFAYLAAGGKMTALCRAINEAGEKAFEHERTLADARGSKLVGLADFVAGKED